MQLDQITFTRFIAALSVVFFHYGQSVFPANVPFLFENVTAGPIAVGYFYVLSGFIMAIAYYQTDVNKQKPINKKKYWVARFARIYPVYLIALLMIVAVKLSVIAENWGQLPLQLLLLQSWVPGYPITLNTPGWSLSVEAFFYLTLPFLLIWAYKLGVRSLVIFCSFLWVATQLLLLFALNSPEYAPKTLLHDFIYYNPLMHLSSFIAGLLVGIYIKHNTAHHQSKDNTFLLIVSFSLIFIFIWARPHLENIIGIKLAFTNGLLAPVFLYFIYLLAQDRGIFTKVLSNSWLVLLGEASYSLYILQKPIHGIYDKAVAPRLALTDGQHFYVFVFILILISIVSYKYIETPMRKSIRNKLA